MTVSLSGVSKRFLRPRKQPVVALDGIDLAVGDGELLVIVGPSGSGKTTLLRSIAGLEEVDSGSITVGGRDVSRIPPGQRDIAMVFQEYALFPHLDVAANIGFGLRARKLPRAEVDTLVGAAASKLGLQEVLDRLPSELSGGERQRVALARAVVRRPAAFLMDEPLSNLDAELRTSMRVEIRALQRSVGTTMIYVTHDQTEALTLGDRVAVLRDGRVEQVASPRDLYERPSTAFVARFIGHPPMNLFPAHLYPDAGAPVLGVRPEALRLVPPASGVLRGRVSAVELLGSETIVHVEVASIRFALRVGANEHPDLGSEVGLDLDRRDLHRFESRDGRALR